MKTYNHAFSFCFVVKSKTPDGKDITSSQFVDAIRAKVLQEHKEGTLIEAINAPFDTYEE